MKILIIALCNLIFWSFSYASVHLEEKSGTFKDDFLIVVNGPFDQEIVEELARNRVVIALDGAANNFLSVGLVPDMIVGDLDSIDPAVREFFKSKGIPIFYLPDQDKTDLEKAIALCDERGAKNITVACALGGDRTDHTLDNFSLLKKLHKPSHNPNRQLSIRTNKEIIQFLRDEDITFEAPVGAKFGLIGFPKAVANSKGEHSKQGLQWELTNYPLELGMSASTCNIIVSSPVTIQVKGEALMVRPCGGNLRGS